MRGSERAFGPRGMGLNNVKAVKKEKSEGRKYGRGEKSVEMEEKKYRRKKKIEGW